jgi:hypothetical protein
LDEQVSPVESVQQHKGPKEALTEFIWVIKGSDAEEECVLNENYFGTTIEIGMDEGEHCIESG